MQPITQLESAFDFSPKTNPVTQDDLRVAQTQTDKPTFGETFRAAAETMTLLWAGLRRNYYRDC